MIAVGKNIKKLLPKINFEVDDIVEINFALSKWPLEPHGFKSNNIVQKDFRYTMGKVLKISEDRKSAVVEIFYEKISINLKCSVLRKVLTN